MGGRRQLRTGFTGSQLVKLVLHKLLPVPHGFVASPQFSASNLQEPYLVVESVGARVRRLKTLFAADDAVVSRCRRTLKKVVVETGSESPPSIALGNDDPVDLDEARSACLKPYEIGAAVLGVLIQGDQQCCRTGYAGGGERTRDDRMPVFVRQE